MSKTRERTELERLVYNALMRLPEDDRCRLLAKYAEKYGIPPKAPSGTK